MGNLCVASGVCWNLGQLMEAIRQHDEHNEMVKLEVVYSFAPGRKCYKWTIFAYDMSEGDDK